MTVLFYLFHLLGDFMRALERLRHDPRGDDGPPDGRRDLSRNVSERLLLVHVAADAEQVGRVDVVLRVHHLKEERTENSNPYPSLVRRALSFTHAKMAFQGFLAPVGPAA